MSSKRSSKVILKQGSPRTSNNSLSSRSSSSAYLTFTDYASNNYGYNYNYASSATSSNMGRSDYLENTSAVRRELFLRVNDPSPSKDGITKISRGTVDVINQEQRREEQNEPRLSDARSSDYRKSSSSHKHKK